MMINPVSPAEAAAPLLDIEALTVEFGGGLRARPVRAVDDVTLSVAAGETVGLVGESGSGKTTIGRAVLGLTAVAGGTIRFGGAEITRATARERRRLSTDLQVVFQDPYSSLNPTRTVGQTLVEPLRFRPGGSAASPAERVAAVLEKVGLDAAAAEKYPSQFSGGQRQRIAIARALVLDPRMVICDEPVSALDLSVQAQVLNLLRQLQRDLGLGYLFIAHDLAVVRFLSHRIVVLYRGRVMEQGAAGSVYERPLHPYTRALLDAAPVPDPVEQRRRRAARHPAPLAHALDSSSGGCPFAIRCPHVVDLCTRSRPRLEATPAGNDVACHRWAELVPPPASR